MRYVIVENIWGVAQRVITWFAFEDSAEEYLNNSDRHYELVEMTKDELKKATDNNGYID